MLDENGLGKIVDTELVDGGFIFSEGFAKDYRFLEESYFNNTFGTDMRVPITHLLKVHQKHPVRIDIHKNNKIRIHPENKFLEKFSEDEMEICEDGENYDLFSCIIVPYKVDDTPWNRLPIHKNSSLLSLKKGSSIKFEDLMNVSRIMSSQVLPHFYRWFVDNYSFAVDKNGERIRGQNFPKVREIENSSYTLLLCNHELEQRFNL
jgi:hypothetical protein